MALAPMSSELRECVVCGLGSHRTDWLKRYQSGATTYVACDNHTDQECMKAVQAASAPAAKN